MNVELFGCSLPTFDWADFTFKGVLEIVKDTWFDSIFDCHFKIGAISFVCLSEATLIAVGNFCLV